MSEAGPEGTHSKAGVGPFGGRIAETALGTALTLSVKTNMVINRPTFFCPDDWREDLVMMMKLNWLYSYLTLSEKCSKELEGNYKE
jgi:hypothetical protein